MKFFRSSFRSSRASSFFSIVLLCGFLATAKAQTAALPPTAALPLLEVTPGILPENGTVTLRLPAGASLPGKRVLVALYEWNRATPAAQVWKVPELREGRWQISVAVNADAGVYEFRLLSTDKIARPLTAKALAPQLSVPGITREAGWWLVNGLPFASLPQRGAVSPAARPLFITGLQRDLSPRGAAPARKNILNQAADWRTLPLPPLREMLATGFDWAALKTELTKRVADAQNRGERGFWGWSLPPGGGKTPLLGAGSILSQLRGAVNEVSPGAALIYEVDATRDVMQTARDLEGAAPFCDAILLRVPDNDSAFWAMKTARRLVEEQPFYDLPIWVRVEKNAPPARETLRTYWMSGATGFLFDEAQTSAEIQQFKDEVARDATLWIGAVTLEDTGILPPPDAPDAVDDEALLQFVNQLRAIGRVPLLARAGATSAPESLMLRLGNRISAATIDRLEKLVRAGAKIYIEGVPTFDETGTAAPWRMGTLVGADVTAMPTRRTNMILDDPWVFGTGRGARLPIEQNFAIKLQESSMAAQSKTKKGVLTQVGPRTAATLEDGSPGLIINVLGKGEVIWLPHRVNGSQASLITAQNGVPTANAPGAPANTPRDSTSPWQKYLNGVADYVSPRLVQQRASEGAKSASGVASVALRRSPKGTLLLWLHRPNKNVASAEIVTEGASKAVLELNNLQTVSTTTRGLRTTFNLEASGETLLALAPTQQELDAERNAPRTKAKLR